MVKALTLTADFPALSSVIHKLDNPIQLHRNMYWRLVFAFLQLNLITRFTQRLRNMNSLLVQGTPLYQ